MAEIRQKLFVVIVVVWSNGTVGQAARIGLDGGWLGISVTVNSELDGVIAGLEEVWSTAELHGIGWRRGRRCSGWMAGIDGRCGTGSAAKAPGLGGSESDTMHSCGD